MPPLQVGIHNRLALAASATLAAGIGLYLWWKQRKGSTLRPPFLDNPKPSGPRKKMTLVRKDKAHTTHTQAVGNICTQISHDTWRFVFALDHPEQPLGLPVGKHLTISCPPPVQRAVAGEWNGQTDTEVRWTGSQYIPYKRPACRQTTEQLRVSIPRPPKGTSSGKWNS